MIPHMPPWLEKAYEEIGVEEIAGPVHNERIVEYHASTGGRESPDEVPWCSSFVNWCMQQAGYDGTNSKAARSWLDWGIQITEPAYGCVCVIWRESVESWKGHVFLFLGEAGDYVYGIGGNQGNQVSIQRYPKNRVLEYRWIF